MLEHFLGESEVLSLAELSRVSGVPKATVIRMMEPFIQHGLIVKSAGGYSLGLRFLEFAAQIDRRLLLRRVALPIMERLRNEVDEAVQLAVVEGDEAVYIAKVDSHRPIRLYTKEGRRAPLYAAACPRVLLAFGSADLVDRVFRRADQWKAYTANTPTDPAQVRALIESVRANGYSISYGELAEGSVAIAVPVMGRQGRALAALSIAGPVDRLVQERFPEYIRRLKEAASEIVAALGYPDSHPPT